MLQSLNESWNGLKTSEKFIGGLQMQIRYYPRLSNELGSGTNVQRTIKGGDMQDNYLIGIISKLLRVTRT